MTTASFSHTTACRRGDTVLDAGTADGYWAFEMERRGAEVTAVDVPAWEDLDFPPQAFSLLSTLPPAHRRERFHEARTRLGSDVRYLDRSIYRLDPDDLGRFDLVHAGDILLHLERPLEALRRLRGVTSENGRLILADVVDPSLPGREGQTFLVRYIGGWDSVTWWTPSIDAAAQMIIDAGFSAVTVHAVYMLPVRGETEGPWRAVFHATA
jgi:tRNA (mo5U34)-methyltransferase